MRTIFSFILASLVVAFLAPMTIEMKFTIIPFGIFIWTLIVVLILVPVTAFPIYKFITKSCDYSLNTVLKSSVISTCLVSFFFVFPSGLDSSIINGKVLVENGSITLIGYGYSFLQLFLFSIVGLVAGIVFYVSKIELNKS
ncbi:MULTISPECIES: hypothetical protein [Pseudoalteromonas]|uniref:hypothetical protein n=1 Tax=Pseudoalteromonas TaxID=53246 RepID=UPI0015F8E7E0|nr:MULTISPECIES: hypothetical protein [Pseudoalteromonas]MBB1329755.1 hypothetical protein [Pseudoalteromonas sp. SR43-7]MBD0409706.1 hypothetical protein [Pseudoalteromonas distincta]